MAKAKQQATIVAAMLGITITSAAQCTGLEKEGAAFISDDGQLIPFASVKAIIGDLVYYADTMNLGTILESKAMGDKAGYMVDDGSGEDVRVIVFDPSIASVVTAPYGLVDVAAGDDGSGDYQEPEQDPEPAPRGGRGRGDDAGDDAPRGGRRGRGDDVGDDPAPRGGRGRGDDAPASGGRRSTFEF